MWGHHWVSSLDPRRVLPVFRRNPTRFPSSLNNSGRSARRGGELRFVTENPAKTSWISEC
jgi:hypothetical protein